MENFKVSNKFVTVEQLAKEANNYNNTDLKFENICVSQINSVLRFNFKSFTEEQVNLINEVEEERLQMREDLIVSNYYGVFMKINALGSKKYNTEDVNLINKLGHLVLFCLLRLCVLQLDFYKNY